MDYFYDDFGVPVNNYDDDDYDINDYDINKYKNSDKKYDYIGEYHTINYPSNDDFRFLGPMEDDDISELKSFSDDHSSRKNRSINSKRENAAKNSVRNRSSLKRAAARPTDKTVKAKSVKNFRPSDIQLPGGNGFLGFIALILYITAFILILVCGATCK